MTERGILYMATGEQYVQEAIRSAESVTQHTDLPTAIATDDEIHSNVFDSVINYQCETVNVNDRDWLLNSTIPPDLSPYDQTLYLDSDTLLRTDVTEVFDLLESYELAIARVPSRPSVAGLPNTWPLLNCGVIAYQDCDAVTQLFEDWRDRYRTGLERQEQPEDQPTFARALYHADVNWYCLPQEYNVRLPRKGLVSGPVKIVHGRHNAGLEAMAEELEQSTRPRVYRERSRWTAPTHRVYDTGTIRYHVEATLANHGVATVAKIGVDYIADTVLGTNRMERHKGLNLG